MQVNKKIVITGEDQWLIKEKITEIIKKTSNIEQTQLLYFRLGDDPNENIIEAIQNRHFFAKTAIILHGDNWHKLKNAEKAHLVTTMERSNNWIFIIFGEAPSVTIKKTFKQYQWETISKITVAKKKQWIIQKFKEENVDAQPEALTYLSRNLANNLLIVKQEIDKIVNYLGKYPQILNKTLCQKITNRYSSGTIFPLIEGLLENNKSKIVSSYQKLAQKNIVNPLVLLSVLQTYLLVLKKIQNLLTQTNDLNTIVQKVKKSNFFVMNLIRILKKTNDDNLKHLIKKMYNLEYRLKTSKLNEKVLLELFLIR